MAQHTIQALQLPVEGFEANLNFYGQLFGWSFEPLPAMPNLRFTQSTNLFFAFSLMHDFHKPGDVMIVRHSAWNICFLRIYKGFY